jgi:hypothetical protein
MNFLINDLNIKPEEKRSDKHLDNLKKFFVDHITDIRPTANIFLKKSVIVNQNYKKNIDLNISNEHFVEFKSISSSFGKNANNRIEEMVGQCYLINNIGKLSYVFVYHDVEEEFKYYNRIKGVAQDLLDINLLHSVVLYKVTNQKVVQDPDLNFDLFLRSMDKNEKSTHNRWFKRILQSICLRSKRIISRATNRWHKRIY